MTRAKRLVRLGAAGLLAVALLVVLRVAIRSFRDDRSPYHPRRGTVPLPADAPVQLTAVEFRDEDGTVLRGWKLPSSNGAAIAFAHGTWGDRRALLPEALALAREGFGALVFDLPGHGESGGRVSFGPTEATALRAAVAELRRDPRVRKVGVYGFSFGSLAAARAAAADETIAAVVLASPLYDPNALTRWENRPWGVIGWGPAFFADWLETGSFGVAGPTPLELVARWKPRPLLLVTGSDDRDIPRETVAALRAAARGPAELLVVEGAGHGDYARADPMYFAKLAAFFRRALLP